MPMSASDGFDEAAIERAIDERVRIVCVSHASYATGALLDVPRIARKCRDAGVLLAVDAYQFDRRGTRSTSKSSAPTSSSAAHISGSVD